MIIIVSYISLTGVLRQREWGRQGGYCYSYGEMTMEESDGRIDARRSATYIVREVKW
jgi:hypothetical protein